jgi:hypothetical protein
MSKTSDKDVFAKHSSNPRKILIIAESLLDYAKKNISEDKFVAQDSV